MANSISATSNTLTATNATLATLATLKAGNAVLCPSFSPFLLIGHIYGKEGKQ